MHWLCVLLFLSQSIPTDLESTGSLRLLFRTTLGYKIADGNVTIRSAHGRLSIDKKMTDGDVVRLPYGSYSVSFYSAFTREVTRQIAIGKPDTLLVLSSPLELMDSPPPRVSVHIKVKPVSSCTNGQFLWVKLSGVFSDFATEGRISQGGFASFDNIDVGEYIVTVVDGKIVRDVQSFTTAGPVTVLTPELSPCLKNPN